MVIVIGGKMVDIAKWILIKPIHVKHLCCDSVTCEG